MREAVQAIKRCLARTRALHQRLVFAHVVFTLFAAAVISPVLGAVFQMAIGLAGEPALADMDIARAMLSPIGVTGVLLALSLLVAVGVLEVSVMMAIDLADRKSKARSVTAAIGFVFWKLRQISVFAWMLVVRILVVVLPFLVPAAVILWLFATEYDINYYLTQKPPSFLLAAMAAGLLILAMTAILIGRFVAWSLALPLILFRSARPMAAFGESARLTQGHRKGMLLIYALWAGAGLAAATVVAAVIGLSGGLAASWLDAGLGQLVLVLYAVLLLWILANTYLTALTTGSLSILFIDRLEAVDADTSAAFVYLTASPAAPNAVMRGGMAALVFSALAGAVAGFALIDDVAVTDRVEIIAHRGASGARPENTLAAMRKAIEDGADWLEIDVQETADGEVVVIHDSDFMKLAGVNLRVRDATMQDLARIDIGSWFSPEYAEERTPTLRAVLDEARGRARVLIELKHYGHGERLEERVVRIVEDAKMSDQIAVMSLDYASIRRTKALRPEWRVGLLAATALGDLNRLEADFLAVSTRLASIDLIRRARRSNRDVYVWTVNASLDMSRMMSRGIAGLITDEPALAREVLSERKELSTAERLLLQMAELFGQRIEIRPRRDASP